MKLHPLTGNHRETAHLLGISQQALWKAVDERGCPVKKRGGRGKPSLYDWADVIPWRLADVAPGALAASRTRLAIAQSLKIERENTVRRAELAEVKDVERAWRKLIESVVSKAELLPERIASELTNISEPAVIERLLRRALYALLIEIADGSG